MLDFVLEVLKPNITLLQYRRVERLIHSENSRDDEYYGNSTNYTTEYIILSELETLLEEMS